MDPLSITASIISILSAAGQIAKLLRPFLSTVKEAARIAAAVYSEVNNCTTILSSLSNLLNNLGALPHGRRGLIHIDQLVATFSDGVLLFSELRAQAVSIGLPSEGWQKRVQWARKEKIFLQLLLRLLHFKSSINIMINILQCGSDLEAIKQQRQLSEVVEMLIESNLNLAQRMSHLEKSFDTETLCASPRDSQAIDVLDVDIAPVLHHSREEIEPRMLKRFSAPQFFTVPRFTFEEDLAVSRPYRNARRDSMDGSHCDSEVLTNAWSAFSGVSLSDISIVSVIRLPVSQSDLDRIGNNVSKKDAFRNANGMLHRASPAPEQSLRNPEFQLRKRSKSEGFSWPYPDSFLRDAFMNEPSVYKIIVAGLCGMTCANQQGLIDCFLTPKQTSPRERRSNPALNHQRTLAVKGERVTVSVFDMSGVRTNFWTMAPHLNIREGVLLAYRVTSRETFAWLSESNKSLRHRTYGYRIPTAIVGIHCMGDEESDREVSVEEGQAVANELECRYVEAWLNEKDTVDYVFCRLVNDVCENAAFLHGIYRKRQGERGHQRRRSWNEKLRQVPSRLLRNV